MGIDFKKLIRWLLPFSWRKIRVQEFIKALFVQIEKLYHSLLSYDKEMKEEAGRTCQTISIEKVLNESFDYPIEIQESDGKPTDFNIIVSGYVDEARLCALVDKYKKAAKSYKINQQGIETVVRFLNHVCIKMPDVITAQFINHVCIKQLHLYSCQFINHVCIKTTEDFYGARFINHICCRSMILTVYPRNPGFAGNTADTVYLHCVINTEEEFEGKTGYIYFTYTLYGITGKNSDILVHETVKRDLFHAKPNAPTINLIASHWVKRGYDSYKLEINAIEPEYYNNFHFRIKNT